MSLCDNGNETVTIAGIEVTAGPLVRVNSENKIVLKTPYNSVNHPVGQINKITARMVSAVDPTAPIESVLTESNAPKPFTNRTLVLVPTIVLVVV